MGMNDGDGEPRPRRIKARSGPTTTASVRSYKARQKLLDQGWKQVSVTLSPLALQALQLAKNLHHTGPRDAIENALIKVYG